MILWAQPLSVCFEKKDIFSLDKLLDRYYSWLHRQRTQVDR